jgi:predicted Zn-dependent protease
MIRTWVSRLIPLVLLVLLAATSGFSADKKKGSSDNPDDIGNRDVDGRVNLYSLEKEIQLGKQLAQEVEQGAKIVDDPVVAEYVNRLGQNLVRNSDAQVPFTIKVIDSDEVNAFALPGGYFFVNSGLTRTSSGCNTCTPPDTTRRRLWTSSRRSRRWRRRSPAPCRPYSARTLLQTSGLKNHRRTSRRC